MNRDRKTRWTSADCRCIYLLLVRTSYVSFWPLWFRGWSIMERQEEKQSVYVRFDRLRRRWEVGTYLVMIVGGPVSGFGWNQVLPVRACRKAGDTFRWTHLTFFNRILKNNLRIPTSKGWACEFKGVSGSSGVTVGSWSLTFPGRAAHIWPAVSGGQINRHSDQNGGHQVSHDDPSQRN